MSVFRRLRPGQVQERSEWLVAALREGGLIAFPTDTVWGVGALATSPEGVAALYRVKGKALDQALPCLIPHTEAALALFDPLPEALVALMYRRWPGPLTVIGPVRSGFLPAVRAGKTTIGLRVPASPPLLDLLSTLPAPLASSSANPSGAPPLTSADEVEAVLGGALAAILAWDTPPSGSASTVVAFEGDHLRILRRGDGADELQEALIDGD